MAENQTPNTENINNTENNSVSAESETNTQTNKNPQQAEPQTNNPEQKQEPNISQKSSQGKGILFFFLGFTLISVIVFYCLFLWGLLSGNISNPIFDIFGVNPTQLKQTMLTITNYLFLFLTLIVGLNTLIKFFHWLMANETDYYKKYYLKKGWIYFVLLIVLITVWVVLYKFIAAASISNKVNSQESYITSDLKTLVGLTSPQMIEFKLKDEFYSEISKDLIDNITWDFGDGSIPASGNSVSHKFKNKGNNNGKFDVCATVEYRNLSGTKSEKPYIECVAVIIANEAVIAEIVADVDKGQAPLLINFSAKNSVDPDGAIVLYEWDLNGDGEYEVSGTEKTSAEATFKQIGEHKIKVRVTGQNTGDIAIAEKTIIVSPPDEKVQAQISSSNSSFSGIVPLNITLDGGNSFSQYGGITKYTWQIEGEAKPTYGQKIKRKFSTPGEYTVNLIVENMNGDRDQTSQIIKVHKKQNVVITTDPSPIKGVLEGTIPFKVSFSGLQSEIANAVSYAWYIDDSEEAEDYSETTWYTFREPGVHTVKLVITDVDGSVFEQTQEITARLSDLIPKIVATPNSGSVPLKVRFDGSGSRTSQGEIIDFIWEIADEEPLHYTSQITKEFNTVGIHNVKLTILTSTGKKATTETFISVRNQALSAKFTAKPTPTNPLEYLFDSLLSTGDISEYYWSFGDGTVSREALPRHTYQYPGTYQVKLKITGLNNIISERTETIEVEKN